MNNNDNAIRKLAQEIVEMTRESIAPNKASGELETSISYVIQQNGTSYTISIMGNDYAKFLDSGSGPHYGDKSAEPDENNIHKLNREAITSILKWSEGKGLNGWAVVTNIKYYGTKPHPYLEDLMDDVLVQADFSHFMDSNITKVYQELRDAFTKQK